MSGRMDTLNEVLREADDLLFTVDDETITESLERGRPPDWVAISEDVDVCAFCGHGWHGLGCYSVPGYTLANGSADLFPVGGGIIDTYSLELTEERDGWCRCDSSLQRRDETWRPLGAYRQRSWERLDREGWDGYAIKAWLGRPANYARVEVRWDADDAVDAMDTLRAALSRMRRAADEFSGALRVSLAQTQTAQTVSVPVLDEEAPETPQERALRLVRRRGTGPVVARAQTARRPRRAT